VKQGLGSSIACVCVRAECRRHGHGSDTKLMVCTRQGNKERRTARNGPAALVRHIRRRTTSWVRVCVCTGLARKDRTSARWWCVQATRRWHSRGDGTMPTICTRQRDRNRVTASGEVRTTRVCAHTTPGPKRQGLRSMVVCSACGCRRQARTRRALVGTRSTRCKARSARVAVGSGTCKRLARLDDRLSSDGGSAQRRGAGQRSTNKQRAHKARSSLGSKVGSTTR
jgi:hypothetical protein